MPLFDKVHRAIHYPPDRRFRVWINYWFTFVLAVVVPSITQTCRPLYRKAPATATTPAGPQHLRSEAPEHILQTSALINEAHLRLVDQPQIRWENRAHFFGIAARLMRRILVDDARKRNSAKRGGSLIQVPLDEAASVAQEQAASVAALDGGFEETGNN